MALLWTSTLLCCLLLVQEPFADASAFPALPLGAQSSNMMPGGIKFYEMPGHKCGSGESNFGYAIISPREGVVREPKKLFLELMGGSICYSAESCTDNNLQRWLDIRRYFLNYLSGTSEAMFEALQNGLEVPVTLFGTFQPGYLPFEDDHPHAGRYGIYLPACTADAFLGTCIMNYSRQSSNQSQRVHHLGGTGYGLILDAIKAWMPDLEEISLVGSSGSAMGSIAWSEVVADAFPNAQIRVLADSAFHLVPGRAIYRFFYDHVPWSPNPALASRPERENHLEGDSAPRLSFDWRDLETIPKMLQRYGGRVKLAYIACHRDRIVYSDRQLLKSHSTFTGVVNQLPEMWWFLQNLHEKAPTGSAFSYIQNGTCHQQIRHGWEPAIEGQIEPRTFVNNFLRGLPPDANNACKRNFWCCGMDGTGNFSEICDIGTETGRASGLSTALSAALLWLLALSAMLSH